MKSVWIVAFNTFREIIRDRILYGIMVFAMMLIGFSMALGQLSFAEQVRITANFGLSAIQLSAVVLSIFLGSTLVTKEIDKKTIMTLLARPVSRHQFLLGKALGLLLVQGVVILGLAAILLAIFYFIGVEFQWAILQALHGVFLEALVLLGLSLMFSIFATPMMVVAFSLGLFLIGHWLDSLSYFAAKAQGEGARVLSKALMRILPNLEHFNWRAAVIYSDKIAMSDIGFATLYALGWFVVCMFLAAVIFRRRDFG